MNKSKIKKLLFKYRVPDNVLEHMIKVSALALFLGEKLKKLGYEINLNLLRQTGLLHDILKVCDFKSLDHTLFNQKVTAGDLRVWKDITKKYQKIGHVLAGAELMNSLNEDKIALLIKKHRFGCVVAPDSEERPNSFEEMIIYYADKRVTHDKIVSLKDRLDDLAKRYSKTGLDEKTKKIYLAIYRLEKKICTAAKINPGQITDQKISNSSQYKGVISYLK